MLRPRRLPVARRSRRGFTLFEVAVAAVVLAILAAVTVPHVLDALAKKRIEDTYELLLELHAGFTNSQQTGFMNVVRTGGGTTNTHTVPGKLSHLSERILSNNAIDYPNSCGSTYNATASTTWTLGGPFIGRAVSTVTGLRSPIGQIQDDLIRSHPVGTRPAWILIRISDVDPEDAAALDRRMDGVDSPTTGAIRYVVSGGVATVDYAIAVFNRC